MRFSTIAITAAFGAFAAAATPQTVQVQDFTLRDIDSSIKSVTFTVSPDNVKCTSDGTSGFASTISCDTTGWSFYINGTNSAYDLTLYKSTGAAVGVTGKSPVQVNCRAGGSSATDNVCSGVVATSITLQ